MNQSIALSTFYHERSLKTDCGEKDIEDSFRMIACQT